MGVLELGLKAGVAVAAVANAAGAAAAGTDCPPTIAAAEAMLARQGRVPGATAEAYPQRYRTTGLRVLGATPSVLRVSRAPGVLWSFSYELPVNYEIGYRRAFEAAYPTRGGFTYNCPANRQCLWSADGYGADGVQPQHVVGNLLQVGLTASYSNEGVYVLECVYVARRPAGR
ncbi:MAG: hypothetical protein QOI38_627 [Sphingomonadales bacterium]|jgi:hypothetical protein|nr:hypothetical protein [Sphingomonadales bacterium]